jgi:hypothetical protein
MATEEYNQASSALLQAVKRLCRPLLSLLIAKGIIYPQLREMLKALYVEVAEEDFAVADKASTDSRLYILTGVHRKDIRRLRQSSDQPDESVTQVATLGGAIVSRWLGLPTYQDEKGEPRKLARNSASDQPGFDQLVSGVSKDVRPRAILDEWQRLGVVAVDSGGAVSLNRKAFIPAADFSQQAFFLGRNVCDHLAACSHNMQQQGEPMFERSVYYSSLCPQSVQQLREVAQREGMALLQKLNRQALQLQQQDKAKPNASERMRFGCYWFDENRPCKEDKA